MTSPLPRIADFGFLIWLVAGMPTAARAVERPSGFGDAPTPSERELAAMPGPNAWFREMAGDWHGPRGLAPLRERWTGFAAADPAYAVLAALVWEAEGDTDRTLAELRALPGDFARWNEGRVLAILGRLNEAESVLSALIPPPARPEVAAAAVLALTELDCIRGDFAAALARTTAAWELRKEDDFRFRLLERHVSLLVEERREGPFLENQVALAAHAATEEERVSAKRLLAAMAPWFGADARLAAAKTEAAALSPMRFPTWRTPGDGSREDFTWAARMLPHGEAPVDPAWSAEAPSEWARVLAGAIARRHDWPARLEDVPFLRRGLREQPLTLGHELFQDLDPTAPPPPLLRGMADAAAATDAPEAVRLTLDLVDRAWSGKAVAADAETLVRIIAAAPGVGGLRDGDLSRVSSVRYNRWPALDGYPSGAVVWNFRGPAWVNHYRLACRLAPLRFHTRPPYVEAISSGTSPAEWRPAFPEGGSANLMRWAWKGLGATGMASAERTSEILARLASPADRVFFAACSGRTDLLAAWCGKAGFAEELPSGAMNLALHSLAEPVLGNSEAVASGREEAVANLVTELAKRVGLAPADLARTQGSIELALPARVAGEWGSLPVDPAVAGIIGASSQNEDWRRAWEKAQPDTLPHPLWEMAVCPSVERIRWARLVLENPPPRGVSRLDTLLAMVFGGSPWSPYTPAPPALAREISGFGTAHPLKQWTGQWAALTEKTGQRRFFRYSFEPEPRPADPTDMAQEEALRTLAAGDPDRLPLAVAAVVLAKDADARAVALSRLTDRGPYREGLFSRTVEVAARAPVAAVPPEDGESAVDAVDAVARVVTRLLAEPESRKLLEPAGSFSGLTAGRDTASALGLAWRRLKAEDKPVLGERLLTLGDPVAARLAVTAASANGDRDLRKTWLAKALGLFPDDPELLMAQALLLSASEEGQPGARDCFQRALRGMMALPVRDFSIAWCGEQDHSHGLWSDPGCVAAIAAFAQRFPSSALAPSWVQSLENALADEQRIGELADLPAVVSTFVKHSPPPPGAGISHAFRWEPALKALWMRDDTGKAAAAAAEALLLRLRGGLVNLSYATEAEARPAPPWAMPFGSGYLGKKCDGWRWLRLAQGDDPAGLADRLAAASAAVPEDEQKALAGFVARGMARPLTTEDVGRLSALSEDGRNRVVAYASWMLSAEELPPPLCVEAWEGRAAAFFAANRESGTRCFTLGLDHMERLPAAGPPGEAALRRVLPAMLRCLAEMSAFPADEWPRITVLTRHSPDEGILERLHRILAERLKTLTNDRAGLTVLAEVLLAYRTPAELPGELAEKVGQALQSLATEGWDGESERAAAALATVAAAFPSWHGTLRNLPRGDKGPRESASPAWGALDTLFKVLDSGLALPEVALRFEAERPTEGTLHWKINGIRMITEAPYHYRAAPAWAPLAAGMAGGFDAVVMAASADADNSASVVARISGLAAEGSVRLSGLPASGRLRLFLVGNETRHPAAAGMGQELGYNSLTPLVDSTGAQRPVSPGPRGWRLLTEPVPLTDVRGWHLEAAGGRLPPRMSVLLLDDAGQVCADSGRGEWEGRTSRRGSFQNFPGAFLEQSDLALWIPPTIGGDKPQPPRVTGAPAKMALAIPEDYFEETTLDSRNGREEDPPPPRLTVRPWPARRADEEPWRELPAPPPSRLRVIRAWSAPEQPLAAPAIALHPLRVAWVTRRGLHVLALEAPPANSPEMRTRSFDWASEGAPDRVIWQGDTIVVFAQNRALTATNSLTRVFRVRADSLENAEPAALEIPGLGDYPREVWTGTPDVPLFQTRNGLPVLFGILTPEGRLLAWPEGGDPSPGITRILEISGPAAFTFVDRQDDRRVMDWATGTPVVKDMPPPVTDEPGARRPIPAEPTPAIAVGESVDPGRLAADVGPLPLQLNSLRVLSDGRYLGIGPGNALSLVLMESVPRGGEPKEDPAK